MPRTRRTLTTVTAVTVTLAFFCVAPAPAFARDTLRVVGSSTVFPFATAVAERFGRGTSFRTPVVESTGTGGGLKLFCAGLGFQHPDIANASRRIKASEVARCERNGVREIVEVKFGYDGIVIANAKSAQRYELSEQQIFLALAKRVPVNGALRANPHRRWSDIAPTLPDVAIEVFGPPPTSGTRDAFVELAMESGARQIPQLAALHKKDKQRFKAIAHAVREDGAYVEAGENDNLIVQKLEANPNALGIFGFSFLNQNGDRVQGSRVAGALPSFENIASGRYGISRSLYFYVKKAHVDAGVPGLRQYLREFTSDRAIGEEGYLTDKGLIPLPAPERRAVRRAATKLEALAL